MAKTKSTQDLLMSIVLDRSGSMGGVRSATIEGFNTFVDKQKDEVGGELRMSLVQFDYPEKIETNFVGVPIDEVPPLSFDSYVPRGSTALYDAIVKTIHDTKEWIEESGWEGRVLVLIVTDGYENSSVEASVDQVKELISSCEDELGWGFVYLGADLDVAAVTMDTGISGGVAVAAGSAAMSNAWAANSTSTSQTRHSTSTGSGLSTMYAASVQSDYDQKMEEEKKTESGKLTPSSSSSA